MITHDTPDSSHLARLQYDETTGKLMVEFRNGRSYEYANVPYQVWNDFVDAPSAGKFFNAHIKDRYDAKPL